jgi:hypothetical protein
MGWWDNLMDKVRDGMRSFLEIQPPITRSYNVWGTVDFYGNAIKNRIWYRGQANELEQFWKETPSPADRLRFWSAVPLAGREIEKIHTGLPALVVDMLTDIVVSDLVQVDAGEGAIAEAWDEMAEENDFRHVLSDAVRDVLVVGDGAFRVSIDRELSALPIIEFVPGDRCDYHYRRGRLHKVCFRSEKDGLEIVEEYTRGRIENKVKRDGAEVRPSEAGLDMPDFYEWDGDFMLAVPLKFFPSKLYDDRGGSIFDAKSGAFDALDECWSQWMDALRKARTKEYVPEALIPRSPQTGELRMPSPFDNAYIMVEGTVSEGVANKVEVVQPEIRHDGYLATYVNALDMCLMGLVSPSTLGIDVKKLDNAEAQREKEKATLYTRNKMVTVLQATLPKLVRAAVHAWQTSQGMALTDFDVDVQFGEYANPSFESVVETVGKAKVQGIMSVEACVEELYGDTRDDEWKAQEVARLKAEGGMAEVMEPTVGITWEDVIGASAAEQPPVPDEQA